MDNFVNDYLTTNRMKPYLEKTKNNLKKALKLYEMNIDYSCQLYKLLSILEISLRNLVNKKCVDLFGDDWIINLEYDIHFKVMDRLFMTFSATTKTRLETENIFIIQEDIVKNAITKIKKENKPLTNDNVVSNTVFSFWVRLFSKAYKDILWGGVLSCIFKEKFQRSTIEHSLNELRQLRNRIAHNECIISMKYSPQKHYNRIISILNAIDPKLEKWAKKQVKRKIFEN